VADDPFRLQATQQRANDPAKTALEKSVDQIHTTAEGLAHAVAFTAGVIALARFAPHPVVRATAAFLSGTKAVEFGVVAPTPLIAGNLAPLPLGYVAPQAYGLKPNFYLPRDSSRHIPTIVDQFGIGTGQQRNEDAPQLIADAIAHRKAQEASALALVRKLSDQQLQQIASGNVPSVRPLSTFGQTQPTNAQLVTFAREQLAAREATRPAPPRAPAPSIYGGPAYFPSFQPHTAGHAVESGGGGDYGFGGEPAVESPSGGFFARTAQEASAVIAATPTLGNLAVRVVSAARSAFAASESGADEDAITRARLFHVRSLQLLIAQRVLRPFGLS
jgi:hypothetical protein